MFRLLCWFHRSVVGSLQASDYETYRIWRSPTFRVLEFQPKIFSIQYLPKEIQPQTFTTSQHPSPTLPQPTKIHLRTGSKPPIFTTKMLVHFQKQCITSANFQGFLDAVGIGDQQIISNDLLLLTGPLASMCQ